VGWDLLVRTWIDRVGLLRVLLSSRQQLATDGCFHHRRWRRKESVSGVGDERFCNGGRRVSSNGQQRCGPRRDGPEDGAGRLTLMEVSIAIIARA
jgi:hypothetical protein